MQEERVQKLAERVSALEAVQSLHSRSLEDLDRKFDAMAKTQDEVLVGMKSVQEKMAFVDTLENMHMQMQGIANVAKFVKAAILIVGAVVALIAAVKTGNFDVVLKLLGIIGGTDVS